MVLLFLIIRIFIKSIKIKIYFATFLGISAIFLPMISLPIFAAEDYRNLIGEVTVENYSADVQAAQIDQLPVVDKTLAMTLGSKKLGEDAGLGSQYHVGDMNLISVNGKLI